MALQPDVEAIAIRAVNKLVRADQFSVLPTQRDPWLVIVETAITEAVAAERERCAKVAEDFDQVSLSPKQAIAAAIRKGTP